jgi:hypothetical protein
MNILLHCGPVLIKPTPWIAARREKLQISHLLNIPPALIAVVTKSDAQFYVSILVSGDNVESY